jgi:hypothetical protein
VAKNHVAGVAVALAAAFFSVQAMGQASGDSLPGLKASLVGSAVTCTQPEKPTERITVPQRLARKAKLKARLLSLLHESLYDDSKGIVNVTREKEITDLAKKLKDDKGE